MKYLLFICAEGMPTPEELVVLQRECPRWVDEMQGRGVRLIGRELDLPETAVTVRVRDGETLVTDGPFAETKEFVAGFDVLECADLDEAIEVAAKHPSSWFQTIEIRPFSDGLELDDGAMGFGAGDDSAGTPYCLLKCLDGIPGEPEVEQSVMREGMAWWEDLKARGLGVFAHPLQNKDTATTLRVRDGETLLSDGPFIETKEFIGGLSVIRCASREQAIEIAAAHPLARHHMIEVRPFRERVTTPAAHQALDAAFREEWGRVVAALIRRTGDWDLAEECAQEAFAQALRRWPADGVPQRPGAWLTTVAGNRAIDRLRRRTRGAELLERAGREAPPPDPDGEAMPELFHESDEIEDDRLRLIFTCCHPALPLEGRVALTLRSLAGLTTPEIARAFLVPEATMAKRLTRAKAKIEGAGIPYRVPPAHLLPERTAGVLAVLYLMFNEGYSASSGSELIRAGLCDEAIRLARALQQLMPDEPEVAGAQALMLLHHSRRDARVGADGELVTLEDQDRRRWDEVEIEDALATLESALRRRQVGPYQLQAAIAACHARADSAADTDWLEIAGLYALLEERMPSPVVRLNRAVAVAMAGDLDAGLAIVEELRSDARLERYYLLEATRADLLRRRGGHAAAAAAYRRALALAPSEVERRFLSGRLGEVGAGADP